MGSYPIMWTDLKLDKRTSRNLGFQYWDLKDTVHECTFNVLRRPRSRLSRRSTTTFLKVPHGPKY